MSLYFFYLESLTSINLEPNTFAIYFEFQYLLNLVGRSVSMTAYHNTLKNAELPVCKSASIKERQVDLISFPNLFKLAIIMP